MCHPRSTVLLPRESYPRCVVCGHRQGDPVATRYQPRRWLTEHYRRAQARKYRAAHP